MDVGTVSPDSGHWTLYVNGEPVANDKMSEDEIRKALGAQWLAEE